MPIEFKEIIIERDIDRLLKEELECNVAFREWFLSNAGFDRRENNKFVAIGHSVTDNELGESDLVLCVERSTGLHAVLIENKIDAPLQPKQGDRYRQRGARGITQGSWNSYSTCLIAPLKYQGNVERDIFDHHVSYEDIARWFNSHAEKDLRMAYQARMLDKAIEEGKIGYSKVMQPIVTRFWHQYWELVQRRYRNLNMPRPETLGFKSKWIYFYPAELDKGIYLIHKMARGYVDLQFSKKADGSRLMEMATKALGKDMGLERRGSLKAVSILVPKVDVYGDFDEQVESILIALRAAIRLVKWYTRHR